MKLVFTPFLIGLVILNLICIMLQIFSTVEEYAPGFKDSIVGYEVLPPPDLEKVFGLTGGVSTFKYL